MFGVELSGRGGVWNVVKPEWERPAVKTGTLAPGLKYIKVGGYILKSDYAKRANRAVDFFTGCSANELRY